jgi:hypothetical protein
VDGEPVGDDAPDGRVPYAQGVEGVIVLSGAAPVLVLFTDLPKPVQALPAALAALAAGVAASFHWHEDAVRWAATRELLKSELRQFRTGAAHYGSNLTQAQALDAFVTRVETIVVGELSSWQQLEQKPASVQKMCELTRTSFKRPQVVDELLDHLGKDRTAVPLVATFSVLLVLALPALDQHSFAIRPG